VRPRRQGLGLLCGPSTSPLDGMRRGHRALVDPAAQSADPNLPAFIARPAGSPVYYGFPLLPEAETDGWCLGAITNFTDPEGVDWGDAFVVAPDGSRAGLIWHIGSEPIREVLPPSPGRWGVYDVGFAGPVRDVHDLIREFRAVLPKLVEIHARIKGNAV
jgi:hypothetical protein